MRISYLLAPTVSLFSVSLASALLLACQDGNDFSQNYTPSLLEAHYLHLPDTTLTFVWDATTAQTVSVNSNGAWTATTTASWLTVGGGSGTADGSFTVQPNSNNTSTTAARTATVTVSCGTATPVTISVTQNKKGYVSASPTTLTFVWDATTAQTVSVSSNVTWTATTTASWLTVGGGSGTADGSFTVRPNSNNTSTTAARTATVTVSCGTAAPVTISVTQKEKDYVSASPTTLTFAWDATTVQTVSVNSNGAWTATTTASWLTVGGGSGTADGSFTVRPNSNNTSTTARTATVTVSCGTAAPVTISVTQTKMTEGYDNGHAWVDLGLSVRWATMNVGASSATDYGDYYAWGETTTKSDYSWSTYKYCNGSYYTLTKYNNSSSYGTVDNKTTLEPADDVAHVKWGGNWRMPTDSELSELYNTNNCDWTRCKEGNTEFGGVAGWKVTSKKDGYTDKYIFLPAAGWRDGTSLGYAGSSSEYWSSSLDESRPCWACFIYFYDWGPHLENNVRFLGRSVRPVSEQ